MATIPPSIVGTLHDSQVAPTTDPATWDVAVVGTVAFVINNHGVTAVSIATPASPAILGSWVKPSDHSLAGGWALYGDRLLVSTYRSSSDYLYAIDITDPSDLTATQAFGRRLTRALMRGEYYVGPIPVGVGDGNLAALRMTSLAFPSITLHNIVNMGPGLYDTRGIAQLDDRRFILWGRDEYGVALVDWPNPAQPPTFLGNIASSTLVGISDVIGLGGRYALALVARRVIVIDFATPTAPVIVGEFYHQLMNATRRALMLRENVVAVTGGNTFAVADFTDPTAPTLISDLSSTDLRSAAGMARVGARHVVVTQLTGLTVLDPGLNDPPRAPTLLAPSGSVIDLGQAQRFSLQFDDPDPGDSQSALRIWARPAGAQAWTVDTGWQSTPNPWHEFPAGTFAEGEWEWQAATKDAQGVEGPPSASGFFTAGTRPSPPAITAPVNGATISVPQAAIVWSTPDQDAYQAQVVDGGQVIHDTGQVNSPAVRQAVVPLPDNQTTRVLRVRVLDAGLWSDWATITVQVSYTPPPTPTLTLTPVATIPGAPPGTQDALDVTPRFPTTVGTEPAVVAYDVWVRGGPEGTIRIARDVPPSQPHRWLLPASDTDYEARVVAHGANGTTAQSAWTA